MNLAAALSQERPIRRKGWSNWYNPETSMALSAGTRVWIAAEYGAPVVLEHEDFNADDWETKPETMRVEFTCRWIRNDLGGVLPRVEPKYLEDLRSLANSSKRFKVICVEI